MDPRAIWDRLHDKSLPFDDRVEAALNLLVWLAKGGGIEGIPHGRRQVVKECEATIIQAIEIIPGGTARMMGL